MSSLPSPLTPSYVIRAEEDHDARPARMNEDLRANHFAALGIADPRLVDPHLEQVVERAEMAARARGFKAGYAAGRAAGHDEGLARVDVQRQMLLAQDEVDRAARVAYLDELTMNLRQELTAAVDVQLPRIEELRDLVATMTVELAEALVGRHLEVDGCAARDAVLRALRQVPHSTRFTIRVNPVDVELVEALEDTMLDWELATVVADESVERGGAIILAGNLEVDAQMRIALERVKKVLHP